MILSLPLPHFPLLEDGCSHMSCIVLSRKFTHRILLNSWWFCLYLFLIFLTTAFHLSRMVPVGRSGSVTGVSPGFPAGSSWLLPGPSITPLAPLTGTLTAADTHITATLATGLQPLACCTLTLHPPCLCLKALEDSTRLQGLLCLCLLISLFQHVR